MRRARVALGTGCFVVLLAACVGGPGQLPDQGQSQGGGSDDDTAGGGSGSGPRPDDSPPTAPPTVSVASFDVSCEEDIDCVAVYEGPACQPCRCPNAAISRKDLDRYAKDLARASEDCDLGEVDCAACAPQAVACDSQTKRCGLVESPADSG